MTIFSFYQKILILQVVRGVKGQKIAQNDEKLSFALHISGTIHHGDISRVFLGRPVTSWSSPSPFPPPGLAEIFKPCASRCSKNALPGRACS